MEELNFKVFKDFKLEDFKDFKTFELVPGDKFKMEFEVSKHCIVSVKIAELNIDPCL